MTHRAFLCIAVCLVTSVLLAPSSRAEEKNEHRSATTEATSAAVQQAILQLRTDMGHARAMLKALEKKVRIRHNATSNEATSARLHAQQIAIRQRLKDLRASAAKVRTTAKRLEAQRKASESKPTSRSPRMVKSFKITSREDGGSSIVREGEIELPLIERRTLVLEKHDSKPSNPVKDFVSKRFKMLVPDVELEEVLGLESEPRTKAKKIRVRKRAKAPKGVKKQMLRTQGKPQQSLEVRVRRLERMNVDLRRQVQALQKAMKQRRGQEGLRNSRRRTDRRNRGQAQRRHDGPGPDGWPEDHPRNEEDHRGHDGHRDSDGHRGPNGDRGPGKQQDMNQRLESIERLLRQLVRQPSRRSLPAQERARDTQARAARRASKAKAAKLPKSAKAKRAKPRRSGKARKRSMPPGGERAPDDK